MLFSVILRFGNKNFANLGSSFFDTPTILTSYLEFTHHKNTHVGKSPTKDNLLAFYIEDKQEWLEQIKSMQEAGFILVPSYNPYWDKHGKTFEDIDGYRIVLQNSSSEV
ncbi:VOC family protein [Xenorhabdus sp. Sc-CR9]|uniref:VOC family protein n=1 Tax=Xenorhabdus sp. Sc-CR9 TaxID=2584468 RepID=UPI001F263E56